MHPSIFQAVVKLEKVGNTQTQRKYATGNGGNRQPDSSERGHRDRRYADIAENRKPRLATS